MKTPTTPIAAAADLPLIERLRLSTAGRYEIDRELGAGGMATVFKAREVALDRIVAIKVMSVAVSNTPGAVERFRREARMAAALSHPHIVPIYSIGEDPTLAYFVMKFIEGKALDSVLTTEGPQSLEFVRRTFAAVGGALDYAHQNGVVHRDVKPANVMIDRAGWTFVTDFGIAKRDDGAGLTQSGTIIGTPAYMSPEQFNGAAVTGSADQYSLGVVLFEMLAGRAPFNGPSLGEIMRGHILDPVPPLRDDRPDLPPTIERLVTRMLAKTPEERFSTLADAVRGFEAAVAVVSTEQRAWTGSRADQQRPEAVAAATTPIPRPITSTARASISGSSGQKRTAAIRAAIEEAGQRAPRSSWRPAFLFLLLLGSIAALSIDQRWVSLAALLDQSPPRIDSSGVLPAPGPVAVTDSGGALGDSSGGPASTATPGVVASPNGTSSVPSTRPPLDSAAVAAPPPRLIAAPSILLEPVVDTEPEPPADSLADTVRNPRAARFRRQQINDRLVERGEDPIDGGVVSVGSQSLRTVLFVNGRQRGVIGGRGIVPIAVPAGRATIAIRRLGCTAWDTTFVIRNGDKHFIGERSPAC